MNRDDLHRMFDLTGRVAVITGGTLGIGRALAEGFAAAEASVVVASSYVTGQLVVADGDNAVSVRHTPCATTPASGRPDVSKRPGSRCGTPSSAPACTGRSTASTTSCRRCRSSPKRTSSTPLRWAACSHRCTSRRTSPPRPPDHDPESLFREERVRGVSVGMTVLCPGHVRTGIADFAGAADRVGVPLDDSAELVAFRRDLASFPDDALEPSDVAEMAMKAIIEQQLYVVTDPNLMPLVQIRFDDIMALRNPSF